ncbi:MAG: selenocysteine-specific translation elongation factor [Fusobacterium mortiferum]|uniref:selenocysteine-specific translation elongation factor n=1 Tax=Fusobacterium mortiferum TaxID=850 RepID=UPI000E53013C|nr:selenocysteine-specific translation elongation factor [Fusobacterium mortiferum]MDY4800047.1 selenocysteine-specific translation elongation factor [Fusobacterium mortiferum]MDY5981659.1 selenocysteine-specific translation elongation factor [Fusobacterium mortiferum]RHF67320.1 selenocysteine-specific translation elongation factor [Fusobacterium mortiferum]
MRDIVVGMAGHIDHGKTTVVKYLTGVDTDTLPEEKSRGMTINLGFTQIKFDDGSRVGLIDVPGHEKFIKNMSAGVSGVDYLLMVIACDDGIMPQTEEHFQILKLFGVKKGMILLTKRDLVDEKRYEEVKKQCREYFKGSFLENSPLLPLSITDIESYNTLKNLLKEELKKIDLEEKERYFRMDIDRVFSVKGFGCVVTGTVKSGKISVGDTLTIYPQNKMVKVKGLESHGEKKDSIGTGNRCAINLAGIESSEIKRGDIIGKSLLTGDKIECKLTLLESSPKIKNNHRIRLNIGTDEIIGRVKIYEKNCILAGESAFVQIDLEEVLGGVLKERGIVRNYSPISTIGGIELLDFSKKEFNRKDTKQIELLKVLSQEDNEKKVEELIKIDRELENIFSLFGEEISLENLIETKKVFLLDKKYIHRDILLEKISIIVDELEKFYSENRLVRGILKSQIKERYFKNYSLKDYNKFFDLDLVKEKIIVVDELVALKEFKIRLNKEEKNMKEEIFSYYKEQKFNLKPYSYYLEVTKDKNLFEQVHRYMVEEGFIQYLEEEYYILNGYLKESTKLITNFLEKNRKIQVKEAKEVLNNSRDSSILILRKLDTLKVTKNIDGVRVLIK